MVLYFKPLRLWGRGRAEKCLLPPPPHSHVGATAATESHCWLHASHCLGHLDALLCLCMFIARLGSINGEEVELCDWGVLIKKNEQASPQSKVKKVNFLSTRNEVLRNGFMEARANPLIVLLVGRNNTARFLLQWISNSCTRLGKVLRNVEAQETSNGCQRKD